MNLIPYKYIILIFFSLASLSIQAQESDFTLEKTFPVKAGSMTVDELGFIYLVQDNQFFKLGGDGTIISTYGNMTSGDITAADVSNPFKLLLFYMDFGNVEFLDNTLSLSNTISLSIFGLELSTLAAMSYNNGFWVYNPQNMELVRIDQFLQISDRSGNLSQVTGKDLNPNFLLEKDDMVYLNDPEHGILMFDKYGAYYKTLNFKGLEYLQAFDKKIIVVQEEEMIIIDPATMEEISFILPDIKCKKLFISLGSEIKRLFCLDNNALKIYILNKSL